MSLWKMPAVTMGVTTKRVNLKFSRISVLKRERPEPFHMRSRDASCPLGLRSLGSRCEMTAKPRGPDMGNFPINFPLFLRQRASWVHSQ
eukprot:1027916-Prymnesium_polylepis.1